MDVLHQLREYMVKPHVRPWALAAPIAMLLICLPLLRPLRHPDPRDISDDELARLATVQSLVEHRTLAIDNSSFIPAAGTIHKDRHTFSSQPPAMAVLLAGWYWLLHHAGLTFAKNPALVSYLLTMLGVTVPVAMGAGLIYRMARMFELSRPKRAILAVSVALAGGLASYAVVLNGHAPAAALILGAVTCIANVAVSKQPRGTSGWLAIAGMCAALAAAIEPAAVIFLVLFACSILALRWRIPMRLGGLVLYALGAAPPIVLHAAMVMPITGGVLPVQFHPDFAATSAKAQATAVASSADDADEIAAGWWNSLGRNLARLGAALFGSHGIFSHFPIMIVGIFGVAAVMHRHWPLTTKTLATATVAGALAIIILQTVVTSAGAGEMFGPQAFILFLPLLLFWAGAWMRRKHHPAKWAMAACLLLFSIGVGIVGATDPCPREGYDRYSVAQALAKLVHGNAVEERQIVAGR